MALREHSAELRYTHSNVARSIESEGAVVRVLSISHALRNPQVDNHTIFNAPTVFDYEAIVIDPGGVFATVREAIEGSKAHLTYSDVPVANGETTAVAAGVADVLRRRRDEFARALERGAVVAVFAYPQATLTEVSGFSGADRYFFLPAPPGLGWDATMLRGGEGRECAIVDHGHAFAPALDVLRTDLLYRAYFDDRAPGFAGAAHVIARSGGGAPVAASFAVGGGTVVFLPTPRTAAGDLSADLGGAIVEAMRSMLGRSQADPPAWLAGASLPGLAELQTAESEAHERRDSAQRELDEAERATSELSTVRDVLWREGDYALLPAVVRCLELLGFERAGEERMLRSPEGDLLLEIGASDSEVGMQPHYRLRERLDAVIAEEQRAPRGLVIANGDRLRPPASREQPFSESLRIAAEATGYALLTATELFTAASAALGETPDETLAALRRRLVTTDGLVEFDDLLAPETAEGTTS